jgi:hypothetical protein
MNFLPFPSAEIPGTGHSPARLRSRDGTMQAATMVRSVSWLAVVGPLLTAIATHAKTGIRSGPGPFFHDEFDRVSRHSSMKGQDTTRVVRWETQDASNVYTSPTTSPQKRRLKGTTKGQNNLLIPQPFIMLLQPLPALFKAPSSW